MEKNISGKGLFSVLGFSDKKHLRGAAQSLSDHFYKYTINRKGKHKENSSSSLDLQMFTKWAKEDVNECLFPSTTVELELVRQNKQLVALIIPSGAEKTRTQPEDVTKRTVKTPTVKINVENN